jgi:hypothetical protein
MIQGAAFLLSMLIEGVMAAALGACLRRRFDLSRFSASVRAGAAAVIGTGATHPVVWMGFPTLGKMTGTWWGAVTLSETAVVLVEMMFYAASLRGHWRWSFGLSAAANLASFSAGTLVAPLLGSPLWTGSPAP